MAYPDLPKNRLIVGGVDLSARFKMVLADGYTLSPPEPKTHYVDIPGGDGRLDLTEALLGRTAYGVRKQDFTFYLIDVQDIQETIREIVTFLHGKAYDYQLTFDPGYTYHGRFTVTETAQGRYNIGDVVVIKVSVEANPFKIKDGRNFI